MDTNNLKGFSSESLAITERQFFFALTVRGRSFDWILNVHNWWHNSEHACWTVHSVSLSIREFSISNMSLIDIKNSLTMGINFSTPIFLLDSRNIVKASIQFTWNNGRNLATSLTCCCSRGKEGDCEVFCMIGVGRYGLAWSLSLIVMRGRCVSGHVVRESFWGLDKLREVRHFVSLGAELLEAGELSITFPRWWKMSSSHGE